jgi:hypothetical protein
MLDASFSEDYAAQVAADVARRYGLQVSPKVVTSVPIGVSGLPQPVWDGRKLIYPEHDGKKGVPVWRRRTSSDNPKRQGLVDPAVADRRLKVEDLHATGANDFEIADHLGVDVRVIRVDRRALRLRANYIRERGPKTVTEIRYQRIRELVAQGKTKAEMCADMGISDRHLRYLAQQIKVALPLTVRASESRVEQRIADLRRMSAEGLSREAMIAALGIVDRTLRVIANLAGVVLPPKAGGRVRAAVPAGPRRKYTRVQPYPSHDERRAALAGLDLGSMTVGDVSAHFGGAVPVSSIRADFRALGVVPATMARPVVAERNARLQKIKALDVSTMTVAELAARFEVTGSAIRKDLITLGLTAAPDQPWHAHNAAVRARIAEMVAKGFTRAQIIAAEPMSSDTLPRHLREAGLRVPRAGGVRNLRPTYSPPEEMAKLRESIRALRLQGLTIHQIAKQVDRSAGTVSYHVAKLGLAAGATGQGG